MNHVFQWLYQATWLWLPFLVLFLVQALRCPLQVKLVLFKIGHYYIVSMIGLQLLLPNAHLGLRTMLFDLATRAFLFIQAAEMLWATWSGGGTQASAPTGPRQQVLLDADGDDGDDDGGRRQGLTAHQKRLISSALSALLYLGWAVLGVAFAFTLTPGM